MSITSTVSRNFQFGPKTATPENVGPGIYDLGVKPKKYKAPIPFGTTTRRELFPQKEEYTSSIGPGTYDPQPFLRSSSANCHFSLSPDRKYFESDENSGPGPAAYSSLSEWGKRKYQVSGVPIKPKKYSQRQPFQPPENPPLPGPGDYDPALINKKGVPAFSKSRAPQREPVYDNGIPGPGQYKIIEELPPPETIKPSPFFRTKAKREIFDLNDINDGYMLEHTAWQAIPETSGPFGGRTKRILDFGPIETPAKVGPGIYDPKEVSKPRINRNDFGVDRNPYDIKTNPGPGYYYQDSRNTKSALGVIPRAKKPDLWKGMVHITPAPGQYEPHEREVYDRRSLTRIGNPAFKSKEERDCLTNKQPNPGPAAYYVKTGKSQGVKFPRNQRFTKKNFVGPMPMNDAPPPDSYNVRKDGPPKTSGGFIGSELRFSSNKEHWAPGPAEYQDNTKCEMIKPSANVNFDPDQQAHPKFVYK